MNNQQPSSSSTGQQKAMDETEDKQMHKRRVQMKEGSKSDSADQSHGGTAQLNSTATLQQDKNKDVKSQVAEKQREMEQLKSKLKPRARAKIQLSVEHQNSNPVQITDFSKKVVSRIFDYLDINALKESRLVCREWRSEAGKLLLKNFHLVCDEKERCENTLINWIKNANATSKTMAVKLFSGDGKRTLQLLEKFPALSCSITDLTYTEKWDTEILYEILLLLPNLEALETKSLDLNPTQKWLDDIKNPNKLDLLVQKLKTLNKLKLDYGMTKELAQQFFRHGQKFASIQNLELHTAGMNFMSQFMRKSPIHNNYTITRFNLNVDGHYVVEGIRKFLLAIAPSLQHLKLILNSSQERLLLLASSAFEPWTDKFIIPLGLNRVETLEVERAVGKGTFVVKCILAALQLPRLQKLTVDDVLFGREVQKQVDEWNSHESAGGRKLSCESLEELEVVPQFPKFAPSSLISACHQSMIPASPWPRLKSLKCSWNNTGSFDAYFLRELRNLERLELNLLSWNHEESTKKESSQQEKNSMFHLRDDLKSLKSFCLKVPENGQSYQSFAESLVEKDLKFMKILQCVQFHRVVIDAEPLKSTLRPNVRIIFTK